MHDELERPADSTALSSRLRSSVRLTMLDAASAIRAAEKAAGSRVLDVGSSNDDFARALGEAFASAEKNERVTLIAPAARFAASRDSMRRAAEARLGLVAHAMGGHGGEELAALSDIGWGVLCASSPEDAFDLSLVARRAAEDSGVPFVVVHALGEAEHPAGHALAMAGVPEGEPVTTFVGAASQARVKDGRRLQVGDRAFAERVPFALGAALREYGTVSGRRRDVFDKFPLGESPLVLVGMGPVGDALYSAIPTLRARGYDVGAVHITSLRPFPGQRLVKALARALAITVLEPADEPLAHGALLARDLKSAFTDALTWMPGFPGIGRIPKLFVGATGSAFDVADLAAVCDNMLADERGRRVFSFVDVEQSLPRSRPVESTDVTERDLAIRFVLDDVASAEAVLDVVGASLASGAGLRTQGIINVANGATVLDIVAARDHTRGGMARRVCRLVVATERGVSTAGAVVSLHEGSVLAVLGTDPTGVLPEAARTVVRERRARVLPLAVGEASSDGAPRALAVVAAGAALALAHRALNVPVDGVSAGRIVSESHPGADREVTARRVEQAFEATRDAVGTRGRSDGTPVGVA